MTNSSGLLNKNGRLIRNESLNGLNQMVQIMSYCYQYLMQKNHDLRFQLKLNQPDQHLHLYFLLIRKL